MNRLDEQARTSAEEETSTGGPSAIEFLGDDDSSASDVDKEFGEAFPWQNAVVDMLEDEFLSGAVTLGWNEDLAAGWYNSQKLDMVNYLQNEIVPSLFGGDNLEGTGIGGAGGFGFGSETDNIQNIDTLSKFARQYLAAKSPQVRDAFFPNTSADGTNTRRTSGGGGRRGGGGARRLTPQEIRNQFDIDALAESVSEQWRGMLLDKAKDPRGIATAYVDAIVASGGEKKIDFNQFVLGRVRKDPRYATIYANKPEGLSEAQFLQPYVNTASQIMRPQNVGETARAGAQLGSSPGAFRERLGRSEETTGSAPFISTMEARMTDLGKVFRG